MGINWSKYSNEKKQIKIKYLELLRKFYKSRTVNIRDEITNWALGEFPYLKVPKKQFTGTFDHSKIGFFVKEHNFKVTQKAVESEAAKRKLSESEYIAELINIVNSK